MNVTVVAAAGDTSDRAVFRERTFTDGLDRRAARFLTLGRDRAARTRRFGAFARLVTLRAAALRFLTGFLAPFRFAAFAMMGLLIYVSRYRLFLILARFDRRASSETKLPRRAIDLWPQAFAQEKGRPFNESDYNPILPKLNAQQRSMLCVTSATTFRALERFSGLAGCPLPEGFRHFVTSMTAPVASGWSDCRVGLAPAGDRRLLTAHTRNGHSTPLVRFCGG